MQLFQLQHAGARPALRTSSTPQAIDAARGPELLTAKQTTGLREGWLYVSRMRNAIMLMRGRPGDALPADCRGQSTVAKLAGYGLDQCSRLVDDTIRVIRCASRAVSWVFWDEISEE